MDGRAKPLLSGTFYAWRNVHYIDSTAEATFPNVVHRSGTNVMRHQATLFEQAVQRFPWHRFDHHVRRHGADDDQRGFNARMHFSPCWAAHSAATRACAR